MGFATPRTSGLHTLDHPLNRDDAASCKGGGAAQHVVSFLT